MSQTEGAGPNKPEPPAHKRRALLMKGKSEGDGPKKPEPPQLTSAGHSP